MHLVGSSFRRACHPHAHVMVAVVAVCRNALVGTGWSNSCLVCTNRVRKHYSHLVRSSNTTLMHLVGSLLRRACHPHVHVMVAVVIVCRNALVGTGWSNSCLVCTNRFRKLLSPCRVLISACMSSAGGHAHALWLMAVASGRGVGPTTFSQT